MGAGVVHLVVGHHTADGDLRFANVCSQSYGGSCKLVARGRQVDVARKHTHDGA